MIRIATHWRAFCRRPRLAPPPAPPFWRWLAWGLRVGAGRGGLWGDCAGAAALEFALVAPLFIALIVAALQLGLVFLGQQGLESAAQAGARMIQSGQAQQAGWSAGQFKAAACGNLPPFLTCDRLYVEVTVLASLPSAASPAPALSMDAGGPGASNFSYAPGGPDDVVMLRLIYLWPTTTTPLGLDLANQPGGNRMLVSTQLFRNEPYVAVTS